MTHKTILEYAIIGVAKEIDDLEKAINQGKRYLLEYERGEQPKTPKSQHEIKVIIQEKKAEIERLAKIKDDLKWELIEIEQ